MAESWAQDPRDNPLVCSTKEEEATTGGDQADGPSVILNQMEGPGGNRLGFPWLGSTEEWGSTDSDFWQQAESMDRVNNNQEPFEGEGFQGEELLLTPEDDLMTDVVQRLDVKMSAPYSVNHGESATVENDVEIEDASETEESLCPRDQTGNGKPEPLDDVRDANQEQEAVMGSADFKEYEKGLSSQSEQSDMDSNGERDTLEPDIQQLLEMHLSKQKLSAGRKLVNSSDSDQEGHEKEILNAANNEDDVDKTLMILDKPEILNEQECTKATTDKCMESRLPSNQTSESEVHSSDSRDHIFKLALSSELQAPTAQTLEQDMNDNLQEYHKMDLVTEELSCKGEAEKITVSNLGIKSFVYENDCIIKTNFGQGDHMDLHPEQEFNQNSTSSIMSANPAIHYDFSGEVPSHNLEEQDKKPIIYVKQRDHIQMKHGGLFAKEEEACIEFDKMPDKEMQEVCLTGTSNLAPEETTFCQGSDVGKTTPEQHLAKTCDSERSFHQDRDEEQQESSEREGSLNIESNRQLWLSDLLQQELQFRGASSSHELEEYPVEEEYDSEVSKEESDDSHLQTYSPTKCSDDQDSKDDSDEEMQRHDVTDKLDPEVLHLLEMHLLKQQLVVIKEEQEEEPGFDDLHINEQKEHFEAFVASKKIAPVLDIVLEEPEPVDENEQALDTSHEVDFKDVALLEQDPDGKSRFSEVEYHEMSWVDPVELSFKTRATDIAREGLDEVIQESLWQGQSTEQLLGKSIEEMKPCAEEFENMHKDAEDVEADEIIGDLDCHTRYRYKQHVMVDASEIIETSPNYSLEERSYKLTPIKGGLDKLKNTNFFLKEEKQVPLVEESVRGSSFLIHSIRKLESESSGESEVTFENQHNICPGQSTNRISQDRRKDTNIEITIFGEEVKKYFGVPTTTFTETETSTSGNWKNQMSELDERTEFLDSKFPAGIMEPTNLFKVHNLETPYSAERDHNIPQEEQARNDLTSKGASKRSLEAEDQQLMLEIAASAASVTTYKTLKERHAVEREKLEAAPGGVTQKCCTAAEKPEPLRNGEREADLQDQLTDAMEKAMASERRASELQVEVERLRQEIGSLHATRETLRREKNELLLLLSEQKRCLPERGTHWDGEHQKEVTEMPLEASQVPESTALKEAEEEGQNTGNKRAEQLVRLRTEFDFVRDESHAMVEQLTSLQQQLRTLRQGNRKQPSSFLRELLRTSLVAALGILLFWWAADQLG